MIDFDDMNDREADLQEETKQYEAYQGWEQRALNRIMLAPSVSSDHALREEQQPVPAKPSRRREQRLEVAVKHALEGKELKVLLPSRAKFKHVKLALAKRLDSDEILRSGHLMQKSTAGAYIPYKDEDRIGDVKEVLLLRTDLGALGEEDLVLAVSDGELSPAEAAPKSGASAAPRRAPVPASSSSRPAGLGAPKPPTITRKQAMGLQVELHEGFSEAGFQERLRKLVGERDSGALNQQEFTKRRKELLLVVQSEVLPRYGFEGSLVGVFKMMAAMGPYVKDPEFMQWATRTNELLGIDSPPETWGNLSKECKKLRMKDVRPHEERLAAKASAAQLRRAVAGLMPSDPWPTPEQAPAFQLYIVGSWNEHAPVEMEWRGGLFTSLVTVGPKGCETFQLLLDGSWDQTIYPSVPLATPLDSHKILGPDRAGHGKNWQIGKGYPDARDGAVPGADFAIIAIVNKSGRVKVVMWQHLV